MDEKLLQPYKETRTHYNKTGDFRVPQTCDFISSYYCGPTIKKQFKSVCQNCKFVNICT